MIALHGRSTRGADRTVAAWLAKDTGELVAEMFGYYWNPSAPKSSYRNGLRIRTDAIIRTFLAVFGRAGALPNQFLNLC
jgi:hypothetical protein